MDPTDGSPPVGEFAASTDATIMPSTVTSIGTTTSSDTKCGDSDYSCSPIGLLIAVILLVLLLYVILALTRILLCFVYRRRQQNSANAERVNREIEEIGHPFSYLAERGFENGGFVDPPPSYDQLFKRDEPPPIYETPALQRRPPPVLTDLSRMPSSSSITSAPVSYAVSAFIPRSTSRSSLPIGVFGTSIPPVTNIVIDESYRSPNILADSPEEFARPNLLANGNDSTLPRLPEAESPTREALI